MNIPPELLDYLAENLTQDDINKMILQYKWASLTKEQQKAAIRKVIDKILVYNDHIQVYLTVDPVLFTPHAITIGKHRSKNIQDKMMERMKSLTMKQSAYTQWSWIVQRTALNP